ncbi:lipopolysaccharide assembly protein LapA domain-containing protein [Candidatus Kinetoplastidibacterium desouzai]|uniref:lipopolysaccharide assembly protein LapA domain-containing protein n=1 Tax=Candidatus Kinetoplastidibacterium desouzai TaxID=994692 RepID=UPI000A065BCD
MYLFFKFILFMLLLIVSLNNIQPVSINLYESFTISDVPLIFIIFISIFIGFLLGLSSIFFKKTNNNKSKKI